MTKEELHLCECGCGQETNIRRGKAQRFVHGHNRRSTKVYDPIKDKIDREGITQELLKELFDYRDGELYWKVSRANNKIKSGDLAGHISKDIEYHIIRINYRLYRAHRLIFLYHHGYLPQFLDHIDGNKLNNNINNIREATRSQNEMNKKKCKPKNGKLTSSKFKGVYWNIEQRRWKSYIKIDRKQKYLGSFTSEIEAAEAYNTAAIKLFGEFACVNIIDEPKDL